MKEGRKPEYPEKTPDDDYQSIFTVPLPRSSGSFTLRSTSVCPT